MFTKTKRARDRIVADIDRLIRELDSIKGESAILRGVASERCAESIGAVVRDYKKLRNEVRGLL